MAEHEIRFRQATENDVSTLLWLIQVRQVMSTPIVAANGEGCVSGWEPKFIVTSPGITQEYTILESLLKNLQN